MLRAELPEGLLKFTEKALDLGAVPCGVPQTCSVSLKNYGSHEAAFQVSPPCWHAGRSARGSDSPQLCPWARSLLADGASQTTTADCRLTWQAWFGCQAAGQFEPPWNRPPPLYPVGPRCCPTTA
jgi:hypothetical protein